MRKVLALLVFAAVSLYGQVSAPSYLYRSNDTIRTANGAWLLQAGRLRSLGDATIGGRLVLDTLDGTLVATGPLQVNGAISGDTLSGSWTVTGGLTATGAVTFGTSGTTSANTLYFGLGSFVRGRSTAEYVADTMDASKIATLSLGKDYWFGTSDNQSLYFSSNNLRRARVLNTGALEAMRQAPFNAVVRLDTLGVKVLSSAGATVFSVDSTGDVAVNGGDLTSTSATFNLPGGTVSMAGQLTVDTLTSAFVNTATGRSTFKGSVQVDSMLALKQYSGGNRPAGLAGTQSIFARGDSVYHVKADGTLGTMFPATVTGATGDSVWNSIRVDTVRPRSNTNVYFPANIGTNGTITGDTLANNPIGIWSALDSFYVSKSLEVDGDVDFDSVYASVKGSDNANVYIDSNGKLWRTTDTTATAGGAMAANDVADSVAAATHNSRSFNHNKYFSSYFDDFVSNATNTSNTSLGWSQTIANSASISLGSVGASTPDSTVIGKITLTSGTNPAGAIDLTTGNSQVVPGNGLFTWEARVAVTNLTAAGNRFVVRVGMGDQTNTTAYTDALGFKHDSTSGKWIAYVASNSNVDTASVGSDIVATQYYKLRADINNYQARFYIDDVLVRTVNSVTTVPNGNARVFGPHIQLFKMNGATARTLEVDWFYWEKTFTVTR